MPPFSDTPCNFAISGLPARQDWPQMPRDLPQLDYPAQLNCVDALLGPQQLAQYGPRIAIYGEQVCWTYQQLAEQVERFALVLRQHWQLQPGMRVLLRSANDPYSAAALLAVIKIGCIAVPGMPLLRERELHTIIDKAQINAALCSSALLPPLQAALAQSPRQIPVMCVDDTALGGLPSLPQLAQELPQAAVAASQPAACHSQADDICLFAFTSGTTGKPKVAMHSQRDLLSICDLFPCSELAMHSADIVIGTPSLAFTFGLGALLLFPLRHGAATVLRSYAHPAQFAAALVQYQASISFSSPTFYRQLCLAETAGELPPQFARSLRASVAAGEALPLATRDVWQEKTGLQMIDGLGATEMLHIFVAASGAALRRGAIGKAIPGYQVCILDSQGAPVAAGVVGRLAVRGATGCRYLDDVRQRDYVQHGWNITGDACHMDADGYVYYHGRCDDMIISAGYNIAAPEIEDVLLQHPAIAECAVIGVANAVRGQVVQASIVLRAGCDASSALVGQIQDFVKEKIAPYKYPRLIRFVTSLPRTESGKLQRFKLRAAAAIADADAPVPDLPGSQA